MTGILKLNKLILKKVIFKTDIIELGIIMLF